MSRAGTSDRVWVSRRVKKLDNDRAGVYNEAFPSNGFYPEPLMAGQRVLGIQEMSHIKGCVPR